MVRMKWPPTPNHLNCSPNGSILCSVSGPQWGACVLPHPPPPYLRKGLALSLRSEGGVLHLPLKSNT